MYKGKACFEIFNNFFLRSNGSNTKHPIILRKKITSLDGKSLEVTIFTKPSTHAPDKQKAIIKKMPDKLLFDEDIVVLKMGLTI